MPCGFCCAYAKHVSPTQVTLQNMSHVNVKKFDHVTAAYICAYKLQQLPKYFMTNLCHRKLGRCKVHVLCQEDLT